MTNYFATALVAASAMLAASSGPALAGTEPKPHKPARQPQPRHDSQFTGQTGSASYYASKYNGRIAANGSRYNERELTAAHSWLPFGTKVKVSLVAGGPSVVVTITDRLPGNRRIVDLSRAAAEWLGIIQRGVAKVSLTPA